MVFARKEALVLFVLCMAVTGLWRPTAVFAADAPKVVASIGPVHSLVSMVMAGAGEPEQLLPGTVSPHAYQLKPSDAARLEQAKVVFWIGPTLETVMRKPMETIAINAVSVQLMDARAMTILPRREGGVLTDSHGADDGHNHGDDGEGQGSDPHIWLDPVNAIVMLFVISETLGEVDPENAHLYRANAITGIDRLKQLDSDLDRLLSAVRTLPYVAFHDAYQYFEARYGLNPLAVIAVDPEHMPGARRISEVKAALSKSGARCIFTEPQFEPRLVSTLIEGTGARAGKLDPLGLGLPSGPFFYEDLLKGMADDLTSCLIDN